MERELRAFVITFWIVPVTLGFWFVVRSLAICSVPCVLSVHQVVCNVIVLVFVHRTKDP